MIQRCQVLKTRQCCRGRGCDIMFTWRELFLLSLFLVASFAALVLHNKQDTLVTEELALVNTALKVENELGAK